jgi:hypothetical protein
MGFFVSEPKDDYEDKITARILTYTDVAIELAEKLTNASNIRVDSYGVNLTFFKPAETPVNLPAPSDPNEVVESAGL